MGTLYCKKHRPSDETLNRGPDSLWSLKIPGCPSKKSRGVTPAFWPNFPIGLWPSWPPNNSHKLIGFIILSPLHNKLVCGGRSGEIWLPSHHPGGCCTLVVVEEIPPFYVKCFEYPEKRYINSTNYYCTPNHHRLWKLNTGLQETWAMIFSTLPPDSRTLVSKWNTKLALIWKEDFGPLGNSPVLLLLSPGKTPLTTTVAKFLDTSVCGGSWCLDPSLSPFLVKFTQILELILLDNPHKAMVLSVGCASFSSTLFPSTQLSVNMLGYSTLWTASFFGD